VASVAEQAKGISTKDAQTVAASFLSTLESMRGRGVFVKSKEDELEVIERTGSGHQALLDLITKVEEALLMYVAGAVRPSGGGDGGTYGQGKVEERSAEGVIQFDRQMVDSGITEHMIGLIWRLNAAQFAEIGCEDAKMPRFVSVEGDDEDPEKFGRVVELAQKAGLAIVEDEAYRRFGLTRPGPGDKVIEPPKPLMPGGDPFDPFAKPDEEGATDAKKDKPPRETS
jgi:phage gp29-like protein